MNLLDRNLSCFVLYPENVWIKHGKTVSVCFNVDCKFGEMSFRFVRRCFAYRKRNRRKYEKSENIWNLLNVNGHIARWLPHRFPRFFSVAEILVNCSLKRKLSVQLSWPIPFEIYLFLYFAPSLWMCVCVYQISRTKVLATS